MGHITFCELLSCNYSGNWNFKYLRLIMTAKLTFAFAALYLFCLPSMAQNYKQKLTLYAYEQKVYSGVDHQTINIDQTITKPDNNSSVQYFIYAEFPKNDVVKINRIWIYKQAYDVNPEKINTPVITTKTVAIEGESFSDTLVKATQNIVWQLSLIKAKNGGSNKTSLNKKIASNEIVAEYSINKSSLRYASLSKIKKLESAAMQ
jgi:hypothetical protein